jgi:hypothetical protein
MRLLTMVYLLMAAPAAMPAAAYERNVVKDLKEAGQIMPFEVIRDRVASSVRGEYVGAEFDPQTRSYRFRFMNGGNLFNVDVDARTGARLNRRQRF